MKILLKPFQAVSIERGERFAWWLFLALAGFGAGWASAVAYWRDCFPVM
jgi:hypothetical protein